MESNFSSSINPNTMQNSSSVVPPRGEKRKPCNRWTKREKELLTEAVSKFGERNWPAIANYVGSKNTDQCNQHWHRVLNPAISKKPWSQEEDALLHARVKEFGESSWKKVSEGIDGRTDIQCRHRWFMLKKQTEKLSPNTAIAASTKKTTTTTTRRRRNHVPEEDSPTCSVTNNTESKPKRTRQRYKKEEPSMQDKMFQQQDHLQQRLLQYLHPDVPLLQIQTQPLPLPPLQYPQSFSGSEEVGGTSDSDSSQSYVSNVIHQEVMAPVSVSVAVAFADESPSFSAMISTEDHHHHHHWHHVQQLGFHSHQYPIEHHYQDEDEDNNNYNNHIEGNMFLSVYDAPTLSFVSPPQQPQPPKQQQRGGENQGDVMLEKALADIILKNFCETTT